MVQGQGHREMEQGVSSAELSRRDKERRERRGDWRTKDDCDDILKPTTQGQSVTFSDLNIHKAIQTGCFLTFSDMILLAWKPVLQGKPLSTFQARSIQRLPGPDKPVRIVHHRFWLFQVHISQP